jgi:hypothetical protein
VKQIHLPDTICKEKYANISTTHQAIHYFLDSTFLDEELLPIEAIHISSEKLLSTLCRLLYQVSGISSLG